MAWVALLRPALEAQETSQKRSATSALAIAWRRGYPPGACQPGADVNAIALPGCKFAQGRFSHRVAIRRRYIVPGYSSFVRALERLKPLANSNTRIKRS